MEKINERFIRWQQLTIKHFSYTNNLFLGLNLAFLSYSINKFDFIINYNCAFKLFYILGILLLFISFIFGIRCTLTRLKDFRKTTKLIYYRKLKDKNGNISKLQKETKELGKQTWFNLKTQIYSFCFGILIITFLFIIRQFL